VSKRTIRMDLNRVEGDLEVELELDGGTVTDARVVGTMYRGFEQILVGRAPLDALVITPRICGICSTAQLYAAVSALEVAFQSPIAPNGTRIRNLCLMAEAVMSDARHSFLMFAPDFCNVRYQQQPLYEDVLEAFEPPFKGRLAREAVLESKRILGIVIAFGGQWPHSSYMMPGGVTCGLDRSKLQACSEAVEAYRKWYERAVLGCSCERWRALKTVEDFERWLEEDDAHRTSAVGLFTRFGRAIGLTRTGRGSPHLLSAGCYLDPERWQPPFTERPCRWRGGLYDGDSRAIEPFSHLDVVEDVRHAWFVDTKNPVHPSASVTEPAYERGGDRYTFVKGTRYRDRVVQLGPISELIVAGDALITSFYEKEGTSTWLRQFARLHRTAWLLEDMKACVLELLHGLREPTHLEAPTKSEGTGCGFVNAARGSLGHWVRIEGDRIANYQVITPTTWNASPRDSQGRRGHWEESFVGLEIADVENPIELAHVVRSHDACLVCTVHFVEAGRKHSFAPW
jgi:hydrogenase large subunit